MPHKYLKAALWWKKMEESPSLFLHYDEICIHFFFMMYPWKERNSWMPQGLKLWDQPSTHLIQFLKSCAK